MTVEVHSRSRCSDYATVEIGYSLTEIEIYQEDDMRAVKTYAEVASDKSLIIKSLPFPPGSRVEVIVFPAADGEDVFSTMDRIVKRKGIKPLTMKQVGKIVHDARGVR